MTAPAPSIGAPTDPLTIVTGVAAIDTIAVSIGDAVAASDIHRTKLLELVYAGTIRSKKVGKRRLIILASLREYLEGGPDAA